MVSEDLFDQQREVAASTTVVRPVRPRGMLYVSPRQRLWFYLTSRTTKLTALSALCVLVAGTGVVYRDTVALAVERVVNPPAPVVVVATPTPTSVPTFTAEDVRQLADARGDLEDALEDARQVLADGESVLAPSSLFSLSLAVNMGESVLEMSVDVAELTVAAGAVRDDTQRVIGLVEAELERQLLERERIEQEKKEQESKDKTNSGGNNGGGTGAPKQDPPKQTPKPDEPKQVSKSISVTCTGGTASVTFSASGGGEVTLKVGGQTVSGQGSVSVTIQVSGSVTASATATTSVSVLYNWSSDGSVSCT